MGDIMRAGLQEAKVDTVSHPAIVASVSIWSISDLRRPMAYSVVSIGRPIEHFRVRTSCSPVAYKRN